MRALLLALALVAPAVSDSSNQDFWWGGPGTPGPVSYWGNAFDSCNGIYFEYAHSIQLLISYAFHWIHSTGPGCDEMAVVDTDGDGDLDVVGCQSAWDRISHWENIDGYGESWTRTIIADSLDWAISMDCGDVDGDSDADLAVAADDGPYLLENTGSGWQKTAIGSQANCRGIRFADIDQDGDLDIASCNEDPAGLTIWWENLGGTGSSWLPHLISDDYGPELIRIADIDGDGDLDVLIGSNGSNPDIVFMENVDGSGLVWEPHVVCTQISPPYVMIFALEVADLDQDGDLDIVTGGNDMMPEGVVLWIENLDGVGTSWLKRPIDNDLVGANSVDTADLDADGDLDVMATAGEQWGGNLAIWYENIIGDASVWTGHDFEDATTMYPKDIVDADIDIDGDLDVICSDDIAGIRWYEFSRATSGWLESSILDPPGGSQQSWTDLSWEATVLPGTNLTFQVRASNDPSDMGEWSPEISTPGSISAYLPNPCWYFQYRVNMATTSPSSSPMLDEMLVQWNPVGIEGGPEAGEPTLTILSGNPSPGIVTLDVYLPDAGATALGIYDLTGRLVSKPVDGEIEAGHHGLTVSDLPSGLYCILLETPTESICSLLVVLRQGSP
jgi:hypothetical protein